jgi:hypothetical protein
MQKKKTQKSLPRAQYPATLADQNLIASQGF